MIPDFSKGGYLNAYFDLGLIKDTHKDYQCCLCECFIDPAPTSALGFRLKGSIYGRNSEQVGILNEEYIESLQAIIATSIYEIIFAQNSDGSGEDLIVSGSFFYPLKKED